MTELVLSMTIWGSLGVFVLWSGVSAIDVAFYRCIIGIICVGIYLFKNKQSLKVNKNTLIIALAGVFLVLNWVFLFKSFQLSSITIGNMSYYLQPIILIILGIFIYKENVSFRKWILILLAFVGVLLTIDIKTLSSGNILIGVLFALLAALLYSFVTILMKSIKENYFNIIFIQLLIGSLILLPFVSIHKLYISSILYLILIGLVHTVLAYYLYYKAIKKTNFMTIAILSYLDPIVAIATDVIFFKRALNVLQVSGILLTFLAAYFLILSNKPEKNTH